MLPPLPRSWLGRLVSPSGSLSRGVPIRVLIFSLIAAGVWWINHRGHPVHLPVGLHEVAGAVIALILAFRTNTAYGRFWEGRTLWGGIVNGCRNLGRAARLHGRLDPDEARALAAWIVVFAHATRRWLRVETDRPEIARLLSDADRARFEAAPHPPLFAAERLSEAIVGLAEAGRLGPTMQEHCERLTASLVDLLGGCERIAKTPTPAGYVLLLERCIAFYLAALPLALVPELGAASVPVTAMVAYLVLMIEALGRELDDPFGHEPNDLPLSRICTTIEKDLLGSSPEALLWPRGGHADEQAD